MFVRKLGMTVAAALMALAGAGSASAQPVFGPLPVPFDFGAGLAPGLNPDNPPPGANDARCRLTAAHPYPVVLVNPTFTDQAMAWQAGAPLLRDNGYCVYTFNYGSAAWLPGKFPLQGLGDIRASAATLAAEVDTVLAATGARKVDLVGHSQGGGILPMYYLNVLGGYRKVDKLIGISPSNHGTSFDGIFFIRSLFPPVGRWLYDRAHDLLPGIVEEAIGDPVVAEVYGHGDTRPGVSYTTIVTQYDEVVTPFPQQFLSGPRVTNVLLQTGCALDESEHLSSLYDERAWRYVLNALSPQTATPVPCRTESPFFPGVN